MNFQTMSKQRKFILICAVVGVISIFLPWWSISFGGFGGSINGFHGVGVLVFIGFLGAAILSLVGDQTKTLDKTMWTVALVAGAVSLLFTIIFMLNLSGDSFGIGGYGFGLWIGLAASLGTLGSAWMFRAPGDNLKDGFDSLKKNISSATSQGSNTSTSSSNTNSSTTSKVAELEKLIELKAQGKITEEEYQQMKAKIM